MSDLMALIASVPLLGQCTDETPFLRLVGGSGDRTVVADVERSEERGMLSVAVTEGTDVGRRPVIAAVFDIGTAALIAEGSTVSLAQPVAQDGAASGIQRLKAVLEPLKIGR